MLSAGNRSRRGAIIQCSPKTKIFEANQNRPMLEGIRTAAIIYNPLAGRRRGLRIKLLEEARQVLAKAGIECELVPTAAAGQAGMLAVRAANSGANLVIASGGDGTLNEVVNGMTRDPVARQTPLAVLPSGTANVLAKELGIP